LRLHRRYNPEGLTAYNVVPGLMGVILTMTLVMLTAMAMTRERERGTLENLLATPVRPLEMMVGKILPYVIFGYLQVLLIFGASRLAVRRAHARQLRAADGDGAALHHRHAGGGLHLQHHRALADAEHADDDLLLPAQHPAVGLHVPLPRHAALGADGWASCCR
jgi:hypothetical protein